MLACVVAVLAGEVVSVVVAAGKVVLVASTVVAVDPLGVTVVRVPVAAALEVGLLGLISRAAAKAPPAIRTITRAAIMRRSPIFLLRRVAGGGDGGVSLVG